MQQPACQIENLQKFVRPTSVAFAKYTCAIDFSISPACVKKNTFEVNDFQALFYTGACLLFIFYLCVSNLQTKYLSDNVSFYGHKKNEFLHSKNKNEKPHLMAGKLYIYMHRPSKYADTFFDAGECRIHMLTFPFDKLPFVNPFSV